MSKQAEKGKMLPRRSASGTKSTHKTTKKTESRNTKKFGRIPPLHKDRNKFKYTTKSDENTTMQRAGSGIRVSPETRALNGNKLRDTEPRHEFEMLKLYHEEGSDDSLSMISMNSRPSSAATDFPDEVKLRDDDEFIRLEDLSMRDSGRMSVVETRLSDLTVDEISVDSGSPRIQVTQLRDENNNIDEKAEKSNLDSANLAIHTEAVKSEEGLENKQSKVKTAWELNEKFLLTTDFPAEVWEEKFNRKGLNTRRRSSDLLNESFPPLSAVPGFRRSSFPNSLSNSLMLSTSPRELPSLSGRQCKVQLPANFPGLLPPPKGSDSESESSDEEQLDQLFREREQIMRKTDKNVQKNYLDVPSKQANVKNSSAKSSPKSSSSQSPMASTETLAMKVASNEYLAARVVTQLNSAFEETVTINESDDKVTVRESCVTPNLMPRRYSSISFRPNTSSCVDEGTNSLILPSVHNEYSKSLPNLTENKTKRMFVTFENNFPHANVVNLKGKSELAQRCRLINRRLSSEDALVKAMLDKKIKRKSMVKQWVISSTQCT
ncbi:uncharacterized protein LOC144650886 [Oculina patagonica]